MNSEFDLKEYVSNCECPKCGRNRLGRYDDVNLTGVKGGTQKTYTFKCYHCGALYIPVFKKDVSEENIDKAEEVVELLNLTEVNKNGGSVHL